MKFFPTDLSGRWWNGLTLERDFGETERAKSVNQNRGTGFVKSMPVMEICYWLALVKTERALVLSCRHV